MQSLPIIAQESKVEGIILQLHIMPSIVESGQKTIPIGYVNLVNNAGSPVTAPQDLEISLASSDSTVVSVPTTVIIPRNHDYAKFDVTVGDVDGQTLISAKFQDTTVTQTFRVGEVPDQIPNDAKLKINLPTAEMNVNSEMPLSIILQRNGTPLQAPKDIMVSLDYEKSLVRTSDDKLLIKKGSYYGITTLKTLEKVGNAFIKAKADGLQLSTVTSVHITSTSPASLAIHVFPNTVAHTENKIDIFVNLLDSDGSPTVATQDVKLEFFSSSKQFEDSISKAIGPLGATIRKGEFGYHLSHKYVFQSGLATMGTISVGAGAIGLGVTSDTFHVVEPLSASSEKAKNQVVNIYALTELPSNTVSIMVYQINAVEDDSDDKTVQLQKELEKANAEVAVAQTDFDKAHQKLNDVQADPKHTQAQLDAASLENNNALVSLNAAKSRAKGIADTIAEGIKNQHPIDDLAAGMLYPVQLSTVYSSDKLIGNLKVVSTDNDIIKILDPGIIGTSSSYGTAIIASGQKAGQVTLSTALGGLGSGSNVTSVISKLKPAQTKIFSPVGENEIIFNDQGYYELFFILLDSSGRPTNTKDPTKYLITPINSLIEIKPKESFAKMQLSGSLFGSSLQNGMARIETIPIGVEADSSLGVQSDYQLVPSSVTAKILVPFESVVGVESNNPIGAVQLVDFYGNPVPVSNDLNISLKSNNTDIVQVPSTVIIKADSSFVQFPLTTLGKEGIITISATTENVLGSEKQVHVKPVSAKALDIFIRSESDPVGFNKDTNMMVIINDENGPAKGAEVKFTAVNAILSSASVTTDENGVAKVLFKATAGPKSSLTAHVSKEGYTDVEQTKQLDVTGLEAVSTGIFLGIPSWLIYAITAGAIAAIGFVAYTFFLKKPKAKVEEAEQEEI